MTSCRICKNPENNRIHSTREMMFGFGDKFDYLECSRCGCLQILKIPETLSKYYPDSYFSFKRKKPAWKDPLLRLIKRSRAKYHLGEPSALGWLISKVETPREFFQWLRKANVSQDSRILDVGCGSGGFLLKLEKHGFHHLSGIEPFLAEEIQYRNGVRIEKKELPQVEQMFDFVLLNHSFEHMPDPSSALSEVYRILKPNRFALIRTPFADSYAWRTYGTKWVQLDPPRHLFIQTGKSMQYLAAQSGLRLAETVFDSTEFQFLGSEQYLRNIPLTDPRSFLENRKNSCFSSKEVKSFKRKARELNESGEGDQVCFYLFKE